MKRGKDETGTFKVSRPNHQLNLTLAAYLFRAAWSFCSGPGKLQLKPDREVIAGEPLPAAPYDKEALSGIGDGP